MAVYTENTETWAQCDNCGLTMFAGFSCSFSDVIGMKRFGWTFGKRVYCPYCSKDMRGEG